MQVDGYDQYGNIRIVLDGVLMVVPDEPGNRHRKLIAAWEAQGNVVPPYDPPAPGDVPYTLYKSVFIGRMTDVQAETMEAVLASASPKLRLMFNSVEYFVSSDPLFLTLHGAVASALGESVADELLAPD